MEKAARLSSNEDEEGAVAYRRLSMRRIREILILTRFRGHLTIGDLGPRRWSPHAEITSTLRT